MNTTRLIHLTDFHVDPKYKFGSNAECGRPLCCQSDYEDPQNPENAAGKWGDYRLCDMPWHSLESALEDTLHHVVSELSCDQQKKTSRLLFLFQQYDIKLSSSSPNSCNTNSIHLF